MKKGNINMAKEKIRYWYLVESKGDPILSYVVSAISLVKAKESFGSLEKLYHFKMLTNSELVSLTGCCPPSDFQRHQFASNGVMFQKGKGFFMIRIAD